MGWQVLGLGHIDVSEEHTQEILDLMIGDKKKIIDRLLGDDVSDDFEDVDGTDGYISFRMWGNKGLDYSRLDKIKEYCKDKKISIEISVGEYIESQDSYYYNSEDDEE